jgi:hypothetical protein
MKAVKLNLLLLFFLVAYLSCGKPAIKENSANSVMKTKTNSSSSPLLQGESYGHFFVYPVTSDSGIPSKFEFTTTPPNPFSPSGLSYSLPMPCTVKVEVHDVQEKLVDSPDFGYRQAGLYNFNWNSYNLSSGIYFLKLTACDSTIVVKYTLLK